MPEHKEMLDDDWLRARFAVTRIEDDGFSDRVIQRVQRRSVAQRCVLVGAAVIGSALALNAARFLPAIGPIDWPSLAGIAPRGNVIEWLYTHWTIALAALAAGASATVVSLLEN
jgi:hypothetical protein